MTSPASRPTSTALDFRRVFEVAPGRFLVLAPTLEIVGVSDAYLAATMTVRDQIVGRQLFEVFPDNPDDPAATGVQNLRASLTRVIESKRPDRMPIQKYDIRVSTEENAPFEERYWSPLNVPLLDDAGELQAIIHSVEDVTSSVRGRRAATDAQLSADRLVDAVDSMPEAFALFDCLGRLVLSNAAYHAHLGSAVLGTSYRELRERLTALADPASLSSGVASANPFDEGHPEQWSFDLTLRTGAHLRLLGHRTRERGIVEVIWDLTADERQARALRRAQIDADAANAAKSHFLSSMSHELRTPLNAVLGFAQLLRRDRREPLSPKHLDHVDQILRSGEHLLRLIEDILDLSRIESGKLDVTSEPVDPGTTIENVLHTLRPLAGAHGVLLESPRLPPDLPRVTADRKRLEQILLNMTSNAIKYNRPGGHVTLRAMLPEPSRLRFIVEDDGLGVPLEQRDKLFEPFHRAGQEAGPIPGTGIGLAISRQLAELMHGGVGYASQPGAGSTFWVELPVQAE